MKPVSLASTWSVSDLTKVLQQEKENYPKEVYRNSQLFQGLKKRILSEIIDRRLLLSEALRKGTNINEDELQREVQRHKNQYTEMSFQKILKESGISYKEWMQRKRENLIVKKYVDNITSLSEPINQETIKKYYLENIESFKVPESVRVRQIVTDTKEKSESILRRLRNGENFAKLAQDLSLSPDRKNGGDLGFIFKGSFPREFEVCFSMNPGEISPIIPSLYGFHIFKVIEKSPSRTIPLNEAEGKIALLLRQGARQKIREKLILELRSKTKIQINEDLLERVSL